MYGFPRTFQKSRWRNMVRAIGTVDGSNTTFRLPSYAVPGSIRAFQALSTGLAVLTITEVRDSNVVLGITPTVNGSYPSGGYFGSSAASCMVDGARTTPPYWSSAYVVPEISWSFSNRLQVAKSWLSDSTTGGFGGCLTYHLDGSNDGSSWTRMLSAVAKGVMQDIAVASQQAFSVWKVIGDTRGTYEWAIAEIELYTTSSTVLSFTCSAAPTGPVWVSYRMPPAPV